MPLLPRRWAPARVHTSRVATGASGLALASLIARAAIASEGVLEINQTCAVQTGCFAGDAAGLPVTITASGSYRLTSNLAVLNENTDGIQVGADDVSIDLNGLAIQVPVTCSGTPTVSAYRTRGSVRGRVRPSIATPCNRTGRSESSLASRGSLRGIQSSKMDSMASAQARMPWRGERGKGAAGCRH